MNVLNCRFLSVCGFMVAVMAVLPAHAQSQVRFEIEAGSALVERAARVEFSVVFEEPPVVVLLTDTLDERPGLVQVTQVDEGGFEVVAVHPQPVDGLAANDYLQNPVVVNYLAVTEGRYVLPGGMAIEAGRENRQSVVVKNSNGAWKPVPFQQAFGSPPAVFHTLQSDESRRISGRVAQPWIVAASRKVAVDSFELALDAGESGSGALSAAESIGWVAIQRGEVAFLPDDGLAEVQLEVVAQISGVVGPDDDPDQNPVTDFPFDCARVGLSDNYLIHLAAKNTRQNKDGGWVRRCSQTPSSNAVALVVDEDYGSAPRFEREHRQELVSVLGINRAFHARFGLVADYPLDDCGLGLGGGRVIDVGPEAMDGIARGVIAEDVGQLPAPAPQCTAAAMPDTAVIEVADQPPLNLRGAMTVAAWVRAGDPAMAAETFATVVGKGPDAYRLVLERVCISKAPLLPPVVDRSAGLVGCGTVLGIVNRRWVWVARFEFINGLTGAGPSLFVTSSPVADNAFWEPEGEILSGQWQHIAATYDGFELRMFLDGVLRGVVSVGGSVVPINQNDAPLTIGVTAGEAGTWQEPLLGAVDEVTLWSGVLSSEQLEFEHRLRTRECLRCTRQLIFWREVYQN